MQFEVSGKFSVPKDLLILRIVDKSQLCLQHVWEGVVWIFISAIHSSVSFGDGAIQTVILFQRADKQRPTNQPTKFILT